MQLSAAAPGSKLTSPTYKTDLASPSAIGIRRTILCTKSFTFWKYESLKWCTGTKAKGYVTIDFDKTDALIKSANQRFFEVSLEPILPEKIIFDNFDESLFSGRRARCEKDSTQLKPLRPRSCHQAWPQSGLKRPDFFGSAHIDIPNSDNHL